MDKQKIIELKENFKEEENEKVSYLKSDLDKECAVDIESKIAVLGCVRNPQAHTPEECEKCIFNENQCNAKRMAQKVIPLIKKYQYQAISNFVEDLKNSLNDKIGYDNPYVMRHIEESKDRTFQNLNINNNTIVDTVFSIGQHVYMRGFFKEDIDEYIVKSITYEDGELSVGLQHEWDKDSTCYSLSIYHEDDFNRIYTDRKVLEKLIEFETRVTCAQASIVED